MINANQMKGSLIILLFPSYVCIAQIPPGYYNSAQGLTGIYLKTALHNIIDNHSEISYNGLLNAYEKTDVKPNGKVWDMYSDVPGGIPPYEFNFNTDQCGNYSAEGDCFNREHSWPQSWFNSMSGPVSDLFHVYPTDGKVNGQRSNYPFGNVGNASWTSLNGSKLGITSDPGYNGLVFEPIDEYKGDFARTYFYMSTRYFSEDAGWTSSGATDKSEILPWQVNVLLEWHHQDTVSAKEIARNDSVYYKYQHNRNPFIDFPNWADSIWQTTVITFLKEIKNGQSFSIYPNPANDFLFIENCGSSLTFDYQIFNGMGQLIKTGNSNENKIKISILNTGQYFIQIRSNKESYVSKFIKQ